MKIPKIIPVNIQNTRKTDTITHSNSKTDNGYYPTREMLNIPQGYTLTTSRDCFPNIIRLTSDELFDIQFNSGTRLSNNAVLIRPVILSLGEIDIKPTKDNNKLYSIVRKPLEGNLKKQTRLISEEELLQNRSLTRGAIKKVDDGLYEMVFLDKNGEKQNIVAGKEDCLNILRDNLLYM